MIMSKNIETIYFFKAKSVATKRSMELSLSTGVRRIIRILGGSDIISTARSIFWLFSLEMLEDSYLRARETS